MTNAEFREHLEQRTKDFPVAVFKFVDMLAKRNSTRVIAYQLGKSASSIGANYREACRAESRVDFGHKVQVALKEAAESHYWLEILAELHPMHDMIGRLLKECCELRNILQTIGKSVRACKPQTLKPSNFQTLKPSNTQTL